MSDPSDAAAPSACPTCGKPCAWTAQRAGRRLRCACGQVFRMPAQAGGTAVAEATPPAAAKPPAPKPRPAPSPPPETKTAPRTDTETQPYEVDLPDDPPAPAGTPAAAVAHGGKCPACNGKLRAGAVICMNCGFNLAEGRKIETRIETDPAPTAEPPPHTRKR